MLARGGYSSGSSLEWIDHLTGNQRNFDSQVHLWGFLASAICCLLLSSLLTEKELGCQNGRLPCSIARLGKSEALLLWCNLASLQPWGVLRPGEATLGCAAYFVDSVAFCESCVPMLAVASYITLDTRLLRPASIRSSRSWPECRFC